MRQRFGLPSIKVNGKREYVLSTEQGRGDSESAEAELSRIRTLLDREKLIQVLQDGDGDWTSCKDERSLYEVQADKLRDYLLSGTEGEG